MEQFPSSPDDVIDPRWTHNPRAVAPTPHVAGRRNATQPDLDARMRAIVNPWLANDRSAAETLKAFRDLADEQL